MSYRELKKCQIGTKIGYAGCIPKTKRGVAGCIPKIKIMANRDKMGYSGGLAIKEAVVRKGETCDDHDIRSKVQRPYAWDCAIVLHVVAKRREESEKGSVG